MTNWLDVPHKGYPCLEEIELGRQVYKQPLRGIEERNALAMTWKGMLPGMIRRFRNRFRRATRELYSPEDAEADGFMALLKAAELFDPERGCTPHTYAWTWVFNFLYRGYTAALRLHSPNRAFSRLPVGVHRGDVYLEEIADDTGDSPVEVVARKDQINKLRRVIAKLPNDKARDVVLSHADGATFQSLADKYHVSRQAISDMNLKSIKELRWLLMVEKG